VSIEDISRAPMTHYVSLNISFLLPLVSLSYPNIKLRIKP
jgi:hypothetical protein